jgi:UDP-N-acetyl-D-mannosaminuronate dehydrogenase
MESVDSASRSTSAISPGVRPQLGHRFRFVELADDVNEHMPDYLVRRAMLMLNNAGKPMKGNRVLLLGLSYKPNTGDAREDPAGVIVDRLLGLGVEVFAADPHVTEEQVDPWLRASKQPGRRWPWQIWSSSLMTTRSLTFSR